MGAKRIFSDILPRPGVYLLRCTSTGDTYVGSSRSVGSRLTEHRRKIQTRKHAVQKINDLAVAHGIEAFEFRALEYCDESKLDSCEWRWMLKIRPTLNPKLPDYAAASNGTIRWDQPWLRYSESRLREINAKKRDTRAARRLEKTRGNLLASRNS